MDIEGKISEVFLKTIKMFNVTISFLNDAFSYFLNNKENDINLINDDLIDKSLIEIEKDCLSIILRERPFAFDLRKITGIFKLVDDVERLSDHSEDINWCIENLKKSKSSIIQTKYLKEMIETSLKMVNDSYISLVNNDEKLAIEVLKKDDLVDKLYLKVLNELSIWKEKMANNDYFIYTTLIAKYVERIADHASNIAEWAVYIHSGYYKDEMII